ncbi:MAG: DUF4249 domain-containing protein [Bacteroidales bacterium]|nr:DUF4249 domain-containing protein [Bacteroidales bacterium]
MRKIVISALVLISFIACTEKMKIDPQEGDRLVGISGSITDEYKKHEVILSRTEPFYGGMPEMISDATVFVVDGTDTIWFDESDEAGHYLTREELAGQPNHTYHLSVDFTDDNGNHHFYAESKMNENVEAVDSIRVKPWVFNSLELDDKLGVYPYFQSTDDPNTYYMTRVKINNVDVGGDTLTRCMLIKLKGYAGIYFNSPYMVMIMGETPLYSLNQLDSLEVVHTGDTVTLDLWSVPRDYAHYIRDIKNNNGTNPMMGTPHNVRTNICPEGKAVGCFHASSLKQCSVIY